MGAWCIVLLAVMIGAVANEHPPSNPPYLLEEVKATAESRVLERVENLLQALSARIKVLDDQIDGILVAQNETNRSLENVSKQLNNFSTSATQRTINLEHKLELLAQINNSFALRMTNIEHKIGRFAEDTSVYFLQPDPSKNITFEVSRDFVKSSSKFGDGWIIFQRRFNGWVQFYRNWTEYKHGFGEIRGEHWLGLDKLHAIVTTRRHELLVVLENFNGVIAYAHYDDFKIGDESEKYIIKSVGNYTGTAGDSFTYHKGALFSTYDQDNDGYFASCCEIYKSPWWFHSCRYSSLNGVFVNPKSDKQHQGVIWDTFQLSESLKSSKMMVRPITS